MSKRQYLLRYRAIINKLRLGQASFEEIADCLKREEEYSGEDLSISKRTFQRDLNEIRSLFNIDIKSNVLQKYYIAEEGQLEIHNRMLEVFDMLNVLNMANDLSQYIYFEKRRPKGTKHFYGLLHAIKNHLIIHFSYEK